MNEQRSGFLDISTKLIEILQLVGVVVSAIADIKARRKSGVPSAKRIAHLHDSLRATVVADRSLREEEANAGAEKGPEEGAQKELPFR